MNYIQSKYIFVYECPCISNVWYQMIKTNTLAFKTITATHVTHLSSKLQIIRSAHVYSG